MPLAPQSQKPNLRLAARFMQEKSKYQLPPGSTAILIWNFWIRNFLAVTIRLASGTAMANVFPRLMTHMACRWGTLIAKPQTSRFSPCSDSNKTSITFKVDCNTSDKPLFLPVLTHLLTSSESHQSKLWLRYWRKSFLLHALISQFMQLHGRKLFFSKTKTFKQCCCRLAKGEKLFYLLPT